MLSPINIRYIFLLLDSGWSVEYLFRIVMHHIYAKVPLENVSSVTMPKPPEFKKFLELLHLLRKLRRDNVIYYYLGEITEVNVALKHKHKMKNSILSKAEKNESDEEVESEQRKIPPVDSINLVVNEGYLNSPDVKKLYKLLGLSGSPRLIHLIDNHSLQPISKENNMIIFQQRTFLSTLYYLRNAVEFTPDAVKQGLIELSKYPDGKEYNLTDITKGLMRIHVSSRRPDCNVNVKVFYRNHWFYIADNDICTKKSFALIQQLYNLQAGNRATQSPILTIPVK